MVVDDADVHNTSEVLFRLCANTNRRRDSIFQVKAKIDKTFLAASLTTKL